MRGFPELWSYDVMSEGPERDPLDETQLASDPLEVFASWLSEALERSAFPATAVGLSTAGTDGRPSARMVLLKGLDRRGFVFFTNYESRKGIELTENPRAALLFYWPDLQRQVRVEGSASQTSGAESERYFATRSEAKRLGVWASQQSRVVESRAELERRVEEVRERFAGRDIPCPPYWGGFRVTPDTLEFWQGRRSRLHDRFLYTREQQGWRIDRLSP